MKTNYFKYKPEEGQNPYIGFMSFQHFRGEALYSDCIVRPENNFTETEHYECYPVPDYVEENGRAEGYYPDTSIVYIRILWKEFEPQRGEYNYDLIQSTIDKAKTHNQTLAFRLLPHSTRACDDVPDWLKELIDCPARPDGMRVKDSPTDPLFLELFGEAIRKLGERFDADPTFDMMDICLPGAWGEGHNLHLYSDEAIEKLFSVFTDTFKHTRLIGQCARPELIQKFHKTHAVGVRGDGFGSPKHIHELYPKRFEALGDLWKTTPISFEAYWWLGEWQRKGWDIDEIIKQSLAWHISSFNAKSLPIPMEWKDKIDAWVNRMGYHFSIDSFTYPESSKVGETAQFTLCIDNVGVAPIYKKLPLCVHYAGNGETFTSYTNVDITEWLPGKHTVQFSLALPRVPGTYAIEIGIKSPHAPVVYFATDAPRNDGFYKLGEIEIQ